EGLGQDVLHPRRLQDRPHRTARDDAGPLRRGLQVHPRRAEVAGDLARDRGVLERHPHQVLLGVLYRLANGLGHLAGLAEPPPPEHLASGTSRASPTPTPTCPCPSPTTTSAVKENRRPPLTTFATRLMATTRSVRSSALASIRASATRCSSLESQAGGACRVGQGLHPSVVLIAAA